MIAGFNKLDRDHDETVNKALKHVEWNTSNSTRRSVISDAPAFPSLEKSYHETV